MKNLCKSLLFCLFLMIAIGSAYTQIDQGELERNLAPVTFYNYAGPHARVETREQIRQIGVGLGRAIGSGTTRTGSSSRYFVIHSISGPDGDKLDADIFGLGSDIGVDHIRNLRTIIQGYLQTAYSYTERDAALLAEYITIYNAVYRGDGDYFSNRYKVPVVQNLTPHQAGLSVRFDEWPGRTLMLIPLGIGGLSSIDTSAISDSRVIEEMRREDDRGIEQRRDMVDLKEREADDAEQRASDMRDAIRDEERAIAAERDRLEQDRAAGTITQSEAARRADDLDQREQELVLQREQAAEQDQFAEAKRAETQQERESIARDQQAAINNPNQNQPGAGVIGITIERKEVETGMSSSLGRLVLIDSATKRELRRSPLDTVYTRTITFIGGKVLAIAGENRGNGAVRLIEIHPSSLEMVQQGGDDMHPGSLLWVNGSDLYAITVNLSNGTLNLGRFNTNLALQAKSVITVHPNATVSIQQGNLLTQRADGSAVLLNPTDLKER